MAKLLRFKFAVVPAVVASALGGCAASADLTYGEYRFGPGYGTERVYESRIYGDTAQGLGSESCRTVTRSEIDEYGRAVMRERRICKGAPGY